MRWVSLATLVLVGSSACSPAPVQRVRMPAFLPPSPRLQAPPSKPGSLQISLALPAPEAAFDTDVALVFDRPVRPLAPSITAQDASASLLASPDRPIPGTWLWSNGRTLQFLPDNSLPGATNFTVSLPSGLRALDGTTLASSFSYRFRSPLPTVVASTPQQRATEFEPDAPVELTFNQPIAAEVLSRTATLRLVRRGASIPFDTEAVDAASLTFRLRPKTPLPIAETIELTVDGSLTGTEGPLPMGQPFRVSFDTVRPVQAKLECSAPDADRACPEDASMKVMLTRGVPVAALKLNLVTEGGCKPYWPTWLDRTQSTNEVLLSEGDTSTPCVVRLKKGLRDDRGLAVVEERAVGMTWRPAGPRFVWGMRGSVLEPLWVSDPNRQATFAARVIDHYDVASVPLSEQEWIGIYLRSGTGVTAPKPWGRPAAVRDDIEFGPMARRKEARTWQFEAGPDRSNSWVSGIPAAEALGTPAEHGSRLLAVRYPTPSGPRTEWRLTQVTDLAVVATMSPFGSLVWVSRLSDGSPQAEASVSLRRTDGTVVFLGETGPDGVLAIPEQEYRPATVAGRADTEGVLVVRKGSERVIERVYRLAADESAAWPPGLTPAGDVFTNKGIYRRGEVARVAGFIRFRTSTGAEAPRANVRVRLEGLDSRGNRFFEGMAALDSFGRFSADVPVSGAVGFGRAHVRAFLDGADAPPAKDFSYVASAAFEVGAPRTPVHEATVSVARPTYLRGETGEWTVEGKYLFGSPMRGATVRYDLSANPASSAVTVPTGFTTQDPYPPNANAESNRATVGLANGSVALDGTGHAVIRLPLTGFTQTRAATVVLHADVQDATRQSVSDSASAILHPAPVYVALRAGDSRTVAPGATVLAEASVVGLDGAARSGFPLRFDLARRQVVTRDKTATRAASEVITDTIVGGCERTSSHAGVVQCPLRLPTEGRYVVRAHTKTDTGLVVAASTDMRAERTARVLPRVERSDPEQDQFRIRIADEQPYAPGSVATLSIHTPAPGIEALVTVAGGGIQQWKRLRVDRDATVSIPITATMAPRAEVMVRAIRGRGAPPDARGHDESPPELWNEQVYIDVKETRALKVEVTTPREQYRPDDYVHVRVRVTDSSDSPVQAALVLYAVEEGELDLTDYRTPDPFSSFLSWYDSGAWPRSSLDELGELRDLFHTYAWTRAPSVRMGATSVGDRETRWAPVRDRFDPAPWFDADIVTGDDGIAHTSFRLPQQLTAFRVMAVAACKDERAGSAEKRVVVSQPWMLRTAVPRALWEGDSFDAGVVVSSKGVPAGQVEVSLEAEGVLLDPPRTRVVQVPADGETEVRFPVRATAEGTARFTFRAKAGDYRDGVSVQVPVRRHAPVEVTSAAGEARGAALERIGDLSGIRKDVGGLEIALHGSPFDQAAEAVRELVAYPYGCAEQRSSSLVASTVARRWAAQSRFASVDTLVEAGQASLTGLVDLQRTNGSFGFWASSADTDPWLTGYVLLVLGEIKRQGLEAPRGAASRSVWFLERWLGDAPLASSASLESAALFLDALSLQGAVKPELVQRVWEQRARMRLGALALLAHAVRDDAALRAPALQALREAIDAHLQLLGPDTAIVHDAQTAGTDLLDSDTRTTAMALRTLARAPGTDPRTAMLARGLMALRSRSGWGSTQRNAWAVLALESARKKLSAGGQRRQARVLLGNDDLGTLVLTPESPSASVRVPALGLLALKAEAVRIEVADREPLTYEVLLRYAPSVLPTSAIDRGFSVTKSFRPLVDGRPAGRAVVPGSDQAPALRLGELALMDVIVHSRTRRGQVVVDDPMPSGIEAIDPGLATSPQFLQEGYPAVAASSLQDLVADEADALGGNRTRSVRTHKEILPERVLVFIEDMPSGFYRFQTLVRATSPGRFIQPPTTVETMYSPGVFGRTAVGSVAVVP